MLFRSGKVPAQHLQPLPDAGGGHGQRKDKQAAVSLPEWVRSVVREEWTAEVFDAELVRMGGGTSRSAFVCL